MRSFFVTILLSISSFFSTYSQYADITLLKQINLNRNKSFDPTFKFVSRTVLPLTLAVPTGSLVYALIKKDSASRSQAIIYASTLVVSGIITYSLKYAVHRERPYITYPYIDNVTTENDPSFPSGHTSWAFALATSTSINFPRWYVIVPSFLYAGAVGYSRLHLGVHYPSDVFMGALVGSSSAFISYKLNHWLFDNKKN